MTAGLGWLRTLVRQECQACKHYWQAPVHHGCPKCHAPKERVTVEEVTRTEVKRV